MFQLITGLQNCGCLRCKVFLLCMHKGLFCIYVPVKRRPSPDLLLSPIFHGLRGSVSQSLNTRFYPSKGNIFIPTWVCLPHFPLIFWNNNTLKLIGDRLVKSIEATMPMGGQYSLYAIAWNSLEGLPKAILLQLEGRTCFQELDF